MDNSKTLIRYVVLCEKTWIKQLKKLELQEKPIKKTHLEKENKKINFEKKKKKTVQPQPFSSLPGCAACARPLASKPRRSPLRRKDRRLKSASKRNTTQTSNHSKNTTVVLGLLFFFEKGTQTKEHPMSFDRISKKHPGFGSHESHRTDRPSKPSEAPRHPWRPHPAKKGPEARRQRPRSPRGIGKKPTRLNTLHYIMHTYTLT